jgi:heme exporter protein C
MEAAAITAILAALVSFLASVLFLRTRDFRFDALSVATTQAGLSILAVCLIVGVIRGHDVRGLWWTWDSGLTSALICWLLYAAYLLLRRSVEEPTQRATFAAVFSIFAFLDVPIVAVCVFWWAARHPAPSLWVMSSTTLWVTLAMIAVAAALTSIRFRREQQRREADARRREALLVS